MFNSNREISAIEQLADFKQILDGELQKFFKVKAYEAKKISPRSEELASKIAEITLRGGKRIRPALIYYSYIGHGGRNLKEALLASMSIELSETYMLIHDDMMDHDNLRRNGSTIHSYYQNHCPEAFNSTDYGQSMALIAGDMACAWSNEALLDRKLNPRYTIKAADLLNKIYSQEGYGQALDYVSSANNAMTEDDVLLIHRLKTVPYTFDGPMKIGAILAGASEKEVKKIENFSIPLGTAFQIQDDILGIFGSQDKLGKPLGSDIKEGKKTTLIIDALAKADDGQKERLLANLGNPEFNLDEVKQILRQTGSLDKSKKLCQELATEASEAMKTFKIKYEAKSFFLGLGDYMINREY